MAGGTSEHFFGKTIIDRNAKNPRLQSVLAHRKRPLNVFTCCTLLITIIQFIYPFPTAMQGEKGRVIFFFSLVRKMYPKGCFKKSMQNHVFLVCLNRKFSFCRYVCTWRMPGDLCFSWCIDCYDLCKKVVGRSHPTPSLVLCYKMFSVWAPPVNDYCVGCEIMKITIRLVIFSL